MKVTRLTNTYRFAAAVLLTLSGVLTVCASDYQSTVLSFNPVGYYRLSESVSPPAGDIVANAGSLGAAGTGFVIHDTDSAPLVKGGAGVVGSSIAFTNPGASFGYNDASMIDVPYNPALNPNGP